MGIYLPNMEMPTSCADCRLMADGWCYSVGLEQREKISTVKRPTWCPLVPVPEPHGDLIDRDVLMHDTDSFVHKTMLFGGQYVYSEDAIKNAPTIIPADPAEEGE